MRVLLIAYEFPPVVAAQSLRWYYLSDGLARLGHEVMVLTPAFPTLPPFPLPLHPRIQVHRCWPGPFVGLAQRLAPRRAQGKGLAAADADATPWAVRLYSLLRRGLDQVLIPDVRTEWLPFAWRHLRRLLSSRSYDVLVASHEPGVDILLGLKVRARFALPLVIDLADPLVTPYMPRWRRILDQRLERRALQGADLILVTHGAVMTVLRERHAGLRFPHTTVLSQGWPDPPPQDPPDCPELPAQRLNLLFTGTFYPSFRDPAPLAEALHRLPHDEIFLTILGDNRASAQCFNELPNVRLLGKVDPLTSLALQRRADVLINVGNVQGEQVPGKIYEYLGTQRPVLHLQSGPQDPSVELLKELGGGMVVDNRVEPIAERLADLLVRWRAARPLSDVAPDPAALSRHSWRERASSLERLLYKVVDTRKART